jgi:hypothetical protein
MAKERGSLAHRVGGVAQPHLETRLSCYADLNPAFHSDVKGIWDPGTDLVDGHCELTEW